MNRRLLIALLIIIFGVSACGSDTTSSESDKDLPKDETPSDEQEEIIELQGFYVHVPPGYTATGGHDGVKYVNVVLTPTDPQLQYEIEVGYGMAFVSDDYEGIMWVKGHYYETTVSPVDAQGWKSVCQAFTYIRNGESDAASFSDFKPEYGPSQMMGCYRDFKWMEVELRATSGEVSDYPNVLEEFMAVGIDWTD